MSLLTKLQDTKEGLMGLTEEENWVHLGNPTVYCHQESYGYKSRIDAIRAVFDLKGYEERVKNDRFALVEESLREDQDAYWYFNPEEEICMTDNISSLGFSYSYLRFGKEKEETYNGGLK